MIAQIKELFTETKVAGRRERICDIGSSAERIQYRRVPIMTRMKISRMVFPPDCTRDGLCFSLYEGWNVPSLDGVLSIVNTWGPRQWSVLIATYFMTKDPLPLGVSESLGSECVATKYLESYVWMDRGCSVYMLNVRKLLICLVCVVLKHFKNILFIPWIVKNRR